MDSSYANTGAIAPFPSILSDMSEHIASWRLPKIDRFDMQLHSHSMLKSSVARISRRNWIKFHIQNILLHMIA